MKKIAYLFIVGLVAFAATQLIPPPDDFRGLIADSDVRYFAEEVPQVATPVLFAAVQQEAPVETVAPTWMTIVNIVLLAISLLAGGFWANAQGRLSKAAFLIATAVDIMKDNKIDPDEVKRIEEAWKDLVG